LAPKGEAWNAVGSQKLPHRGFVWCLFATKLSSS
jgi:hypothetical protein